MFASLIRHGNRAAPYLLDLFIKVGFFVGKFFLTYHRANLLHIDVSWLAARCRDGVHLGSGVATLAGKSGLNIKVAEDILTLLGITPPYTTDGGNLTLEFTIEAADVVGAAQVFSFDFAFGTYPLQQIQ